LALKENTCLRFVFDIESNFNCNLFVEFVNSEKRDIKNIATEPSIASAAQAGGRFFFGIGALCAAIGLTCTVGALVASINGALDTIDDSKNGIKSRLPNILDRDDFFAFAVAGYGNILGNLSSPFSAVGSWSNHYIDSWYSHIGMKDSNNSQFDPSQTPNNPSAEFKSRYSSKSRSA